VRVAGINLHFRASLRMGAVPQPRIKVPGADREASPPPHDDAMLVLRVANGDAAAFDLLFRRYAPRLKRFLDRVSHRPQLIEEVIDDTMLVVWRKAHTYDLRSKVSTWIFAIGFRRALKALQRADDPLAYEPEEMADIRAADPSDEIERRDTHARLRRAMTSLSAEHRTVIELTYYQGYSCREIARIVGCPVDTVKTRMFHARRRLKLLLADEIRSA